MVCNIPDDCDDQFEYLALEQLSQEIVQLIELAEHSQNPRDVRLQKRIRLKQLELDLREFIKKALLHPEQQTRLVNRIVGRLLSLGQIEDS